MSAEGRRLGPLRLGPRIDIGGMAEVYRAMTVWSSDSTDPPDVEAEDSGARIELEWFTTPPPVGTEVAVKRLLPITADDDELVALFVAEVRTAADQHHPGLCPVYAWGWDGDTPFLVMQLVDGWSWRAVLDQVESRGAVVPTSAAVAFAIQIADALEALHGGASSPAGDSGAHSHGVVHRDVSPHNAMVSRQGRAQLIDFGIATGRGQARQTQHGVVKGKLGYLAPEQLGRQRLDGRTDIFALGVILWETLAGRRLFAGGALPEVVERIQRTRVPAFGEVGRQVPAALEAAVRRALASAPEDRFATAAAFADALRASVPEVSSHPDATLAAWLRVAVADAKTAPDEGTSSIAERFDASAEGRNRETTDRHHPDEATRMVDLAPALDLARRAPAPTEERAIHWLDFVWVGVLLFVSWRVILVLAWG